MNASTDLGKLLLRIAIGGLMLFHGLNKLSGIGGIIKSFESVGLPGFLGNLVYLGEVIAPLMLLIGFRSRIAGLLVSATMVVAIMLKHSDDILTLKGSGAWGIELQMIYLLGGLAIYFLGGGNLAVSSRNRWD